MENSIYEAEITLSVTLMFRSGSDQEAQKEVPQVAKQLAHQIMQIEKVDGVEIKGSIAPPKTASLYKMRKWKRLDLRSRMNT